MTRLRPQIHNGLHWVRGELDQSLTRARTLIEGYAESPKDVLPLQQAYVELHQVRGTASMIQCYGVAAAAEEMKQTVHELMHGKLGEPELAYSVLLGASAQLADYIEAIDNGMDDCALVLQPMINELRLVRSKSVLTEADLFVAQLQSLNLALPAPDAETRLPGAAREQAQRLLPLFQQSLAQWFRDSGDSLSAVARMGRIGEQISQHTRSTPIFLLWRSFAACAEALLQHALVDSLELKRLFGAAGRQIKLLAEQDEEAAAAQLDALPYQLLFHVGRSRGQGPRVTGLRKVFGLSMYLPDTAQLDLLRRKIKGPNVTLLTKVADEIRVDLTQIKDGIDLAVRGGAGAATLKETRGRLKRIADTLSVLGLPVLQRVIGSQVEILDALPVDQPVASTVWMELATAILRVESSLEGALFRTLIQKSLEHPAGAPELEEQTPPPRDVREGRKALLREQLVNLSRFKTGVDALVRNNDPSQLGEAAQMLAEIRAGFGMLESARAAELIGVLERHVRSPAFVAQMRESKERADRFADAIACVEYYLEGVRDELPDVERMLDDLAGFIALLDIVSTPAEPELARTLAAEPSAAVTMRPEPQPEPAIVLAPPAPRDEVDPEIREVFVEEAGEVRSVLEKALPRWTRDVADRATLTDIRRAFHTLKGSGRMVGATDLGEFGWAFESLLNRCLDGAIPTGQPVVELVQQAVALLPTLISDFRDLKPTDARLAPLRERAKVLAAGLSGTAADPEMVAVFREDAVERLAAIKEWLDAQDRSRSEHAVDDDSVRSFHTLRGSAALVKANGIHELAGQTEAYLDAVRGAGRKLPDEALDLLGDIHGRIGEWVAQVGSAEALLPDIAPWSERLQKLQDALPQAAEQSASERELHEIFAGEAFDLVQKMEEHSAAWAAAPANRHPPTELKMLAHTLRGAALMSGCAPIADVSLALGDRISEALTQSANPDAAFFRHLAEIFEKLYQFLDSYREGTLSGDGSEVAQQVATVEFVGSDMLPPAIPPASAKPAPAVEIPAAPPVQMAAAPEPEIESEPEESEPELIEMLRPIEMPDVFPVDEPAPPEPAAPPEPLDESLSTPLFEFESQPATAPPPAPAAAPGIEATPLVAEAGEPPDPELLGIFLAEAQELLENFDTYTAAWEAHPDSEEPPLGLKRVLHTLKGSARMAGLEDVGNLAQRLESEVIGMTRGGTVPEPVFFTRLHHVADGLHHGLDSIGRGGAADFAALLAEFDVPPHEAVASEPAAPAEAADVGAPQEQPAEDWPMFADSAQIAIEETPPPAEEPAPVPAADVPTAAQPVPHQPLLDLTQTLTPGSRLAAATDADLIDTFRAEASELLEVLTDALDTWQSDPHNEQPVRDIQHALHTLKGGARMAGLLAMGSAAHAMEERVEAIERRHASADGEMFGRLRGDLDQLQAMQDLLMRGSIDLLLDESYQLPVLGEALAPEPGLEEPGLELEPMAPVQIDAPQPAAMEPVGIVAAPEPEPEPEPEQEPQPQPEPALQPARPTAIDYGPWDPALFWKPDQVSAGQAAMRRETARVPVEQLDSLLNQAGEISIYRSRLEEHTSGIGAQLNEMSAAIQRVREQLRLMDIETEAQIEARGLSAADTKDRYEAEFDPLEMDRYTRMQELSRALSESVGDLANLRATMDELVSEAETLLLQQGRINTQVQQGLMSTLMVPFSRQAARLQRVVKQAATEERKQAEIVFEGIESELDRNVLERMTAPLEHLLRNAVVHGIETPAVRRTAGKPEQGTVQLSLRREGTQLLIELRDDGRGLDLTAIREQAVRRGLLAADAEVADDALAQFIFEPGFSTAKTLTQSAGRGIGMDVVASEVKQLGGTLELGSQAGRGARFTIRLPLNLAMSQTLLVKAGGETYAVPLSSIEGIARIPRARLEQLFAEDGPAFPYAGNEYRVRHLADYVGLKSELDTDQKTVSAILVRMAEGLGAHERRIAVVVDQLLGNREIVTKPVGPQVSSVAGVTGATILADGRVLLIMDLQALTADRSRRSVITLAPAAEQPQEPALPEAFAEEPVSNLIMVVDDSMGPRAMREPRSASRPGKQDDSDRVDPKSLQPLKRLLPFVLRYPVRLTLTLVFLLIAALTSLAIPAIAGRVVDEGFVAQNLAMVTQYSWLVVIIGAVMGAASGARFYFISIIGERVLTDLRRAVFDHLLTLDAAYFDTHRVGELTSRLNGDVATIRGAVGSSLSMLLRGIVTMLGAVVLMFLTSPFLAIAVVVIAPALIIPVIVFARRLRRMSRRTQDALADMSAMATEALGATKTIKSFVQEPEQSADYGRRAEESFRAEVDRLSARAGLIALIMFMVTVCLVALVWWGAKSVFDGTVTAGELTQFMIYALMATNALASISEIFGTVQTIAGATERLVEILDTKSAIRWPAKPTPLPEPPLGTIAFEDVHFTYETRESEKIIGDLSFAVAQGETVALVGASGAGKSTVFALAQRFYDVSSGRIVVDGIDIREVDPAVLRRRFAYVEQEPTMFAGSVADNIRFGKPEATVAEVESAAKAALVHDFVSELPAGYETIVGERGVMLSGGQKQRVAIARALLKDAPILLLDEATSALDAESERLVQLALERLMQGRTTLVIAHRLATIRDANRILVLEKGRLIDQGTHNQLVAKGGRYAELAKLQFRLDEPIPEVAE